MSAHEPSDDVGAAILAAAQAVHAPQRLRETVQAPRQRRRGRAWGRWLGAAGFAAAALGAALVLAAGGGPSVQEVAAAALQAPTEPAPARDGRHVDAQIAGVRFPDYESRWDWRAIGARRDRVGGRDSLTVIYRRGDLGVHYTVVDGAPLPAPGGARTTDVGGVPVSIARVAGVTTASWRRDGHTCVLATRTADAEQLLELVAWSY